MRTLSERLGESLTGRYFLEGELGRGGMATVFRVRDVRHDRSVALKVLHPEIAAGVGLERFQREIRVAARLQHPHIIAVHDSGELVPLPGEENLLWFTMPLVDGESLRDRLRRDVQFPIGDVLRITRDVAGALDHAHRHGVIHRDIKPENILLTGPHALVADFGVAKSSSDRADGSTGLTMTGTTVGTVAYMSPEQTSGDQTIDGRTDQYSLACVTYEMLVGEPPFTGPTAQAVVTRRFTEEPRSPRATRPSIPIAVERAVLSALSRIPADRFSSVAEFATALGEVTGQEPVAPAARRRIPLAMMLSLAFLLGMGALVGWWKFGGRDTVTDLPLSIAVLSFENQGDSSQAYFAEGMADEVRGKLTGLPGFRVTARSSSGMYRGTKKPLQAVARELGVRYLLIGTVRWLSGDTLDRVQVRPELVEIGPDGTLIAKWEMPFDAPLTDVFEVQATIATQVASALRVAVAPVAASALASTPTSNPGAYDEFLRGEQDYLRSSGPDAMRRAIAHYERAVTLDSSFARAWGRLAQANSSYYAFGRSPDVAVTALRSANKALTLAPTLPEAHLAMGLYFTLVKNDYARAIAAFDAGLALSPAHPELLGSLGLAEQGIGDYTKAIEYMRRGLALDPSSLVHLRRLTRALTWMRRYPEAEMESKRALALGSSDATSLQYAALLKLSQGDLEGARKVFRSIPRDADSLKMLTYWAENPLTGGWALPEDHRRLLLRMSPTEFGSRATWGMSLTRIALGLGDSARARTFADSASLALNPDVNPGGMGYALSVLGRQDDALDWLSKAEAEVVSKQRDGFEGPPLRHGFILQLLAARQYERALTHLEALMRMPNYITAAWLRIDPSFDPLRRDPRFQELLERDGRRE